LYLAYELFPGKTVIDRTKIIRYKIDPHWITILLISWRLEISNLHVVNIHIITCWFYYLFVSDIIVYYSLYCSCLGAHNHLYLFLFFTLNINKVAIFTRSFVPVVYNLCSNNYHSVNFFFFPVHTKNFTYASRGKQLPEIVRVVAANIVY